MPGPYTKKLRMISPEPGLAFLGNLYVPSSHSRYKFKQPKNQKTAPTH